MEIMRGRENAMAVLDLPSSLDYLVSILPDRTLTADYLVNFHTMLSVYAPFIPGQRVLQIREQMKEDNGIGIHMRTGIVASRIPLKKLIRLCKKCVEFDRNLYGESYIHLEHQIPGLPWCHLHGDCILEIEIDLMQSSVRYEFVSAEKLNSDWGNQARTPHIATKYADFYFKMSQDLVWLLDNSLVTLEVGTLQAKYQHYLYTKGLASYSGKMRGRDFSNLFKEYYPSEFLRTIHCELDESIEDNWLFRLVRRKNQFQSPLQNLLLIHFLGYDIKSFLLFDHDKPIFGHKPYPCLNKSCQFFQQDVIPECEISINSNEDGSPTGVFNCPYCDFAYARRGPDKSIEDRYRIGRVVKFGYVWEERLKALYERGEEFGLRAKARELGVDPRTVLRYAKKLTITTDERDESPEITFDDSFLQERENKRNTWLSLIAMNPAMSVTNLRSILPQIYMWLYRNDHKWLLQNPKRCKKQSNIQKRVDWEARDLDYAERCKNAALSLFSIQGRPIWVSKAAIVKNAKIQGDYHHNSEKLSITTETVANLAETLEDFALRRIDWAIEEFRSQNILPKKWQVVRVAAIERHLKNPIITQHLEEVFESDKTWLLS